MKSQVSRTVSTYFAALRQIRSICHCVPRQALLSLVVSLVLSRVDYGNATLAGVSARVQAGCSRLPLSSWSCATVPRQRPPACRRPRYAAAPASKCRKTLPKFETHGPVHKTSKSAHPENWVGSAATAASCSAQPRWCSTHTGTIYDWYEETRMRTQIYKSTKSLDITLKIAQLGRGGERLIIK